MWKSIKNFFKWIADHTGISWIARKISSGWKWLFGGKANTTQQNASQQEKSSGNERQEPAQAQSKVTTTPKTLNDQVNPDQSMPDKPQESVSKTDMNTKQTENSLASNLQNSDNNTLEDKLDDVVGEFKFEDDKFSLSLKR